MSVCNLFKKLSKETGNFLMFSQYTDDLTAWLVRHNNAKVIPSRFIAMNIDYSKLTAEKLEELGLKNTPNEGFPNLMQNYYENACAFFKNYESSDSNVNNFEWTPKVSRSIFWNVFKEYLLDFEDWNTEATSGDDTSLKYSPQVLYRGDINIQSYVEEDNIGYNEIYCYIPNDAKSSKYCLKLNNTDDIEYDKSYIEGYNENDEDFTGLLNISIPEGTTYTYQEGLSWYDENDNDLELMSDSDDSSDDSENFNFNTIVILYNIYSKIGDEDQIVYKDIPLGLYLTGTINDDGTVTNTVTKYVNNSDIYGAGTSWGLRIATRFVATPNATYIKEISVDSEASYADFTKVMSSFAESQQKMDNVLDEVYNNNLSVKQQLSSFKNYRANIPYIVEVGGVKYWFVNGKNTNATIGGAQGVTGPTGPRGADGKSTPGPAGPTGPQGVTGPQGPQGATGPQGVRGIKGSTGVQGVTGPRGAQGVTGPRGAQGVTGSAGVQGVTGPVYNPIHTTTDESNIDLNDSQISGTLSIDGTQNGLLNCTIGNDYSGQNITVNFDNLDSDLIDSGRSVTIDIVIENLANNSIPIQFENRTTDCDLVFTAPDPNTSTGLLNTIPANTLVRYNCLLVNNSPSNMWIITPTLSINIIQPR